MLDEILGKAERLQSFNHDVGDPGYSAKYLERLRNRTPASVKAAANKWLSQPRVVVVTRPAPAAVPVPAAPTPTPPTAPPVAPVTKGGAK